MAYAYDGASRRIHLDFHTPHWVKQVGHRFDGARFVETLQRARVNAVTAVFGLCACGNAYWDTARDDVRHPGLAKDLARELLNAAEGSEVQVYIHFSMAINNRAVERHPDWACARYDGTPFAGGPERAWAWPCLNSPYVTELAWPLLREFLGTYRPRGIFLDMVTFPRGACFCHFCRERMRAEGVDAADPSAHHEFLQRSLDQFVARTFHLVKGLAPEVAFTCNNQVDVGILSRRRQWMDYVELEAPISWNTWSYPIRARYARSCAIPVDGMTTRFLRSWGYFGTITPIPQTRFECASILATAGAVCIGDHLHPSGEPEPVVYESIRTVYAEVQAGEPWTLGAHAVPDVAVLADPIGPDREPRHTYGAAKALLDASRHFDVVDLAGDWEAYRCLILPENESLTAPIAERLERYVWAGGKLVLTGLAPWQATDARPILDRLGGVRFQGESPFHGAYLSFPPTSPLAVGQPSMPHRVNGRFARLHPDAGTTSLARVVHPYEDLDTPPRFGHFHAPPGAEADDAGATHARYGSGQVVCIAAPLAADYFTTGNPSVRRGLSNALDLLIPPGERLIELEQPSPNLEVSLMEKDGVWVVHLVQFAANRGSGANLVEDVPLRTGIGVQVGPPYPVGRVLRVPDGEELEHSFDDRRVRFVVPELRIHAMIVLEPARIVRRVGDLSEGGAVGESHRTV